MAVRALARNWHLQLKKRACRSKLAETEKAGTKVILALPQTYMNLSGLAVKELVAKYKIKPEKLVIIYDDLDLNLAEIRIRLKGSPGSHKGVRSIVQEIGTQVFSRVRIGIGPKPEAQEATAYVLSEFSETEKEKLQMAINGALQAVEMIVKGQINQAMNAFNRKSVDFL
jgi:PTH1 family peptidyl-tRNA hydrolase